MRRLSAGRKYSPTIACGSPAWSGTTACPRARRFPPTAVPSTADDCARSRLGHGRDQALDVLGARQAMVAVLHQREHDVVAGKASGQLDGVLPWHVGVLHALENPYRAAGLDHAVEQQVSASLLDQAAGDGIGLFGILRRT